MNAKGKVVTDKSVNTDPKEDPHYLYRLVNYLSCLGLDVPQKVRFESSTQEEEMWEVAKHLVEHEADILFVKGGIESRDPLENDAVESLRAQLHLEFEHTVFTGITGGSPPIRGPFGEAVIIL